MRQLKRTWDVFLQNLGNFIAKQPEVVGAIRSITSALKVFGKVAGIETRSEVDMLVESINKMSAVFDGQHERFDPSFIETYIKTIDRLNKVLGGQAEGQKPILDITGTEDDGFKGIEKKISKIMSIRKEIGRLAETNRKLGATDEELIKIQLEAFAARELQSTSSWR